MKNTELGSKINPWIEERIPERGRMPLMWFKCVNSISFLPEGNWSVGLLRFNFLLRGLWCLILYLFYFIIIKGFFHGMMGALH